MSDQQKQGLQQRSTLTEDEMREIAELQILCNQHDTIHLVIPPDELRNRSGREIDDFLYYEQGQLAGYLYVDSWGKKEREITGMVRPELRRQGIFRQLFTAALAEYTAQGAEALLLICEPHSHSGHAFARAVKARHDFSEHAMVLGTFTERQQSDPQFLVRPAILSDKQAVISLLAADIGEADDADARQLVEEVYNSSEQKLFIATLAGLPIGTLRLTYQSDAVGIYGFVIQPEYRGKGYGRKCLEQIIHHIKEETSRSIKLEVDTENKVAFGLYKSCGFEVLTTYDYFNRPIER